MNKNFKCDETKKIWDGEVSNKLPRDTQQVARRKLRMMNNAKDINDLRIPPGNHLEPLKGNRKGQHSIRINKKWRICFVWNGGHCFNIEIVDYHH